MMENVGMTAWVPYRRADLFCSGGYTHAEFPNSYSLFPDGHCDPHEVSLNKDLIFTVRRSCDLLTPVHFCLFNS